MKASLFIILAGLLATNVTIAEDNNRLESLIVADVENYDNIDQAGAIAGEALLATALASKPIELKTNAHYKKVIAEINSVPDNQVLFEAQLKQLKERPGFYKRPARKQLAILEKYGFMTAEQKAGKIASLEELMIKSAGKKLYLLKLGVSSLIILDGSRRVLQYSRTEQGLALEADLTNAFHSALQKSKELKERSVQAARSAGKVVDALTEEIPSNDNSNDVQESK